MTVADLTIAEAGAALRSGALTSVALTQAHLDRIARRNPAVQAFVTVTETQALAAAARADSDFAQGTDRGALQGIPFAIKDLIDMAGVETTYGSRRFSGHVPDCDAPVVARLRALGAVPLGKVATYEFALVGPSFDQPYPPARNPWNCDHITGGSSSGSAAAVASGMVRLALGTDTGGSIRSPAAYCGIVGLKPSSGAVCRDGVFPLSPSLDHVGPMAATVAEAALGFAAMAGQDCPFGAGLCGLRIGFARDWIAQDPACAPEVLDAMDAAASVLSLAGASVALVSLPNYGVMEAAGAIILHAEGLQVHRVAMQEAPALYGRQAYQSLASGVGQSARDLARARQAGRVLRASVDRALQGYDAIITATVLAPAPPFTAFLEERAVWTAMRTLPFNLTGHPVLAQPMGFAHGLPLGMQIIGRHGAEAMICGIGAAFEATTDHAAMRPEGLVPDPT